MSVKKHLKLQNFYNIQMLTKLGIATYFKEIKTKIARYRIAQVDTYASNLFFFASL